MDFIESYNSVFRDIKKAGERVKDLKEIKRRHDILGAPSTKYKLIHVAGTNGKGTVSLNIAKGLEKAGYKIGIFSSPHYESFCERIAINGAYISEKRLQQIFAENKAVLGDLMFFEFTFLMACIYFAEEKVDYAVIEAGVGGERDTTNIIVPDLCVITNIGSDHAEYLGGSIETIAQNKAGIIKKGIPVVLGDSAYRKECLDKASAMHAPITTVKGGFTDYLKENKAIADAALAVLNIPLVKEIYTLPARFEVHGNVILDMAHNIEAFVALKRKVEELYPEKEIIALWNMSADKDVEKCLEILQSFVSKVYYYPYDSPRLISKTAAKELCLPTYNGEKGEIILVCGSVYFMKEAKEKLLK